ncbi:glucose 1-dehydrogenase [Cryobacterium glaciale]|uniref:Glucose 1-dehydrogenase n=1 Tax=Cryobacterium glaciale TaxID=1259145 RepID=A0A4R8USW0_9MICO|nr:glucose 1-dehydrogenase [Cryobacterium glaciale]
MLKSKSALVTGAGAGIGRAIAVSYAAEGARVLVSDIDDEAGQRTVDIISAAGGIAAFHHADVSSLADNENLVAAVLQRWGTLDIACNNAGIAPPSTPLADVSEELWLKILAVDLSSVFYGLRSQIPAMIKSGGGAIVNISSILGQVAFSGVGPYVAAKHGVVGLTKSAALEYAAQGIRAVAVGPAFIKTGLETHLDEQSRLSLDSLHPVGRMGEPEEVAELVSWLSSDRASFVNGGYFPVDGGYLTR